MKEQNKQTEKVKIVRTKEDIKRELKEIRVWLGKEWVKAHSTITKHKLESQELSDKTRLIEQAISKIIELHNKIDI